MEECILWTGPKDYPIQPLKSVEAEWVSAKLQSNPEMALGMLLMLDMLFICFLTGVELSKIRLAQLFFFFWVNKSGWVFMWFLNFLSVCTLCEQRMERLPPRPQQLKNYRHSLLRLKQPSYNLCLQEKIHSFQISSSPSSHPEIEHCRFQLGQNLNWRLWLPHSHGSRVTHP